MIREWDHQLCEQQLSSLIPVLDQMRLDLDNTQAEISTVTLPHNKVGAARKSETSPVAADRILTKCQRTAHHPAWARFPARRNAEATTDILHALR